MAREAGVSTATAARALGGYGSVGVATKEVVLAAAERLGYRPNKLASSMITGRTHSLGLIVGDIENPFFSRLARAVIDGARRRGYDVLATNTDENIEAEQTALRVLQEKRVDGLIVSPVSHLGDDRGAELAALDVPLVLVDDYLEDLEVDSVISDNLEGADEAVRALVDAGHRDIALITRSASEHAGDIAQLPVSRSGTERMRGYRAALERLGVPRRPEFERRGGLRVEHGALAMDALLALPQRPTAVITTNAIIALGVLDSLRRHNLTAPADMSIVSFDDPPWAAHTSPRLTTVDQPTAEIGDLAVNLLIDRIENIRSDFGVHRLPTRLIRRDSIRPR
ncbi:LacI family DNA-binding transcriptional regulator [Microbacterium sp. NPDC058389]|uniref:LacI family DNA-binding transcriptional regulator n=1 Tax=Microbacterium sp. NPDC058389 TaxID=3346475 RepID=UPI003660B8F6